MRDELRRGTAGLPGPEAGRTPEAWGSIANDGLDDVVRSLTHRAFLYEDPPSFAAGVTELARALRDSFALQGGMSPGAAA